jgi:hypothetical protein
MGSTPLENLNEIMCLLQTTVAKVINDKVQRINHVFGARYGSTVVNTPAYQATLIRYMYNNSTKAKLVQRAGDYPYSTLQYYLDGTWEERGLTLDPYLASLSPEERMDFFLSLNASQMEDKSFEEFGKKLKRKVYL